MEVNPPLLFGLRIFDKDGDGNRSTCALSENVVFLLAAAFARCAGITAQVEDIQAGKFFCQTFAYTVKSIAVNPACIGYITDYALFPYTFRRPADGADIAVIKIFLQGCRWIGGIGFCNAFIQVRIRNIFIAIVFTFLPCGIGWISDNDTDVQGFLPFAACAVVHQHFVQHVACLVHLEGISQADAFKGNVWDVVWNIAVNVACQYAVVGRFDVDGGDVVGEQDDFVGVDFAFVFFRQPVARDDAALQQAGDEGTRAGEGVEDVHAFVLQAAFEFVL